MYDVIWEAYQNNLRSSFLSVSAINFSITASVCRYALLYYLQYMVGGECTHYYMGPIDTGKAQYAKFHWTCLRELLKWTGAWRATRAFVTAMSLRKLLSKANPNCNGSQNDDDEKAKKQTRVALGNGSEVVLIPRFLSFDRAWNWFDYLNTEIPWTRPTIRVFGRSCLQPRETCYVASPGLPQLVYSGYQPHPYSWDDFPPLKELLEVVHKSLPGSSFNSLLLNRYKDGNDYVAWHSDDEKVYGSTPEIASLSFGCEREFFLKKKPTKTPQDRKNDQETTSKRLKRNHEDQQSFVLKHGSLLVMRGYTQRDWLHSVPKRTKLEAIRINLTFRLVLESEGSR